MRELAPPIEELADSQEEGMGDANQPPDGETKPTESDKELLRGLTGGEGG